MTTVIDGDAIAADVRADLSAAIDRLDEAGVTPGLATVLMSDDPAPATYVSLKQQDCAEVGIESIHVEIDPDDPAEELYATIDDLNEDPAVHGILVQTPIAEQVDYDEVVRRLDPLKDVDGFHPENVGLLVGGSARFKPCTPHGVQVMLDRVGVDTEGKDVVVIGRSRIVGRPMANLLIQRGERGNATTTVCHSRTRDLGTKTRRADIVIVAAGVPELIDGSMLSPGTVVIDVGYNRVERDGETVTVGDVAFDSAKEKASVISPVPGGVGPMTRAMLLYNAVTAASLQSGVDVTLPS
jgi:methylenetetrahydrofolate dehydrogenase (NADP+)/methenyltetrahydrofolate cyclohydrolase